VNVSKAELEGAFADELALLEPTVGYMRLVKDRILHVWEQRRAEAKDRTAEQEKRVKVIQQKLDRLDEAFLFAQSIDGTSYERRRDRIREELTLAQIDHHAESPPRKGVKTTNRWLAPVGAPVSLCTGADGLDRYNPARRVRVRRRTPNSWNGSGVRLYTHPKTAVGQLRCARGG
jgi:hypothetical protein